MFFTWKRFFSKAKNQNRKTRRAAITRAKPTVEVLEDRIAPTVGVYWNPVSNYLTVNAANNGATLTVGTSGGQPSITLTNDSFGPLPAGFSTSGNTLTTTNTVASLFIGGPGNSTDTGDTVTLGNVTLSGSLTVSGQAINFTKGDSAVAASATLTSVNSLTFAQTGVPYTGSVTINPGAPAGQPYAGDMYLTGPNWGAYGYAPGDFISFNADNGKATGGNLQVAAIVGDNLYIQLPPVFPGPTSSTTYSDTSVQCSNFTPQLQANSMSLYVTGVGSSISGAISSPGSGFISGPVLLQNVSTAGGNISLQDLPPALIGLGVHLGNLNAGAGTIHLAVNGPILNQASSGPNLTASAVDLISTGLLGLIGGPGGPLTTQSGAPGQSLQLTATTNNGDVDIKDSSSAGLTINSVTADQNGQAATVQNGQILYNSTPDSTTGSTYVAGSANVGITSTGPVVLNSVSATGDITIGGLYILEGTAKSATVTAQIATLVATGTAEYQGQVTFAQAQGGDTLTNTGGWSGFQTGGSIVISGAATSADGGVFTIKSVSGNTLTLTQSYVLAPETDANVKVGDGMIGLASAPVSLSTVPLINAITSNGSIYLNAGSAVNSTAQYVAAGGSSNNASVTNNANFLTVEDIQAGGAAAVAANTGALVEYNPGGTITVNGKTYAPSGMISGNTVSLTSPSNIGTVSAPFNTGATSGLTVNATATASYSAGIYVVNTSTLAAIGITTYDGNVTIKGSGSNLLTFAGNVLTEPGSAVVAFANTDGDNGSAGDVIVNGSVDAASIMAGIDVNGTAGAGQILTPTSSDKISGAGGAVILSAASGIGVSGTPVNITNLGTPIPGAPSLIATTTTGDIVLNGTGSGLSLNATTSTGNINVTWAGDIALNSEASNTPGLVLDSIAAPGTVTLDAVGGAIVDQNLSPVSASTLNLTATNGIGTAGAPLQTTSRGTTTMTATTTGGGVFVDSNTALTVDQATVTGTGNLAIVADGNLTLAGLVSGENPKLTVTAGPLTATAAGMLTATAGTPLKITATQIGLPAGVIQTNAATINVSASSGGIYLSNNDSGNPLTLTAAAVGTATGPTANNIEIYNAGLIVLQQQTNALTQLASALPIAVFCPGGALTLEAGATLSFGGTPPGTGTSIIASATPAALATSTLDPYGEVASVSLAFPGSGYKTAPTVTFSGGGGFGATAKATINAQGQVTGIILTSAGSGYTSAPTVTLSPPGDDVYTGTYNINGYNSNINPVTSGSLYGLPSLVIISGTSEVNPHGQAGVAPALISYADLTSLALLTGGNGTVPVLNGTETVSTSNGVTTVTIVAAAITIEDLGLYGNGGAAVIPNGWSLNLDATNGSIVFLNMGDTIQTTSGGNITIAAGTGSADVAALGNLTTGGGNITINAGGNIAIGTLNAAGGTSYGAIAVTSANGVILFNNAGAPNLVASSTRLTQATQPVATAQSAALAQLHATEVIAAADAASAQANAMAAAAGAQAAAELATVNSLQAALTSIQAAVTTANQTYQTDVGITNQENNVVNADTATVNNLTDEVAKLTDAAAAVDLTHAVLDAVKAIFDALTAPAKGAAVPGLAEGPFAADALFDDAGAALGLTSASINERAAEVTDELNAASKTLAADSGVLSQDQTNQTQAAAQLQADMDTQSALAAALDVAQQAYAASEQTYVNDQTYSAQIQAQGDAAQATAIADVVFSAPAQPLNATGPNNGPVTITALSPLTISANQITTSALNLNSAPDDPQTEVDTLTINSGVTVQSTQSSVSLEAGNNVIIQSGATVQAAAGPSPGVSAITITADENLDPNGATVTVAGTLTAPSATIGIPSNATGPITVNITPSSTPITVDSAAGATTTLNIDTQGLPVTVSNGTIQVGTYPAVSFNNVQAVHLENETGILTVDGTPGTANTLNLVGTGPGAGTATLDGVAFSFAGLTGLNYVGGGTATSGDSITVTPPSGPWMSTVSLAGGSTGTPATLTYNAPGPNSTVTATGKNVGTVTNPAGGTLNFSNVNQVSVAYNGTTQTLLVPNPTVTDSGGVYNGHPFLATAKVNGAASLDGIKPTVTYYSGTNAIPAFQLSGAPTNVGTYTVVAAYAGDTTYSSGLVSQTFYITPATATVVVTPYTVTYDGLAHTATVTSITGVNGETGALVGTVDLSNTTHTDAGVYTSDTWTFTGSNYNTIANAPITDTINKANATVVVTPYTVVYDGHPHTATYTITGVNGETGATVGIVDVSKTTHTSAGVYSSDLWDFTGTANYNNTNLTPITDAIFNSPPPYTPNYTDLGGYVTQIATTTNATGTMTVFGIGGDGAVYYRQENTGNDPTQFGQWTRLGGYAKGLAVSPQGPGLPPAVFVIGGDNQVWANTTLTPGAWTSLGSGGGSAIQLAAALDNSGNLEVFAISGGHAAFVNTSLTPGAWTPLGGYVTQIAVGQNGDTNKTLQVFGIGGDNAAWTDKETSPGAFTGWHSLGGFITGVTVGQNLDGTLQVFAVGGDHSAWTIKQTAPGNFMSAGFTSWNPLGGYVSDLTAARNFDGTLSFFGIGGDGAVWSRTQSTPGAYLGANFSKYQSFGGYAKQVVAGDLANQTVQFFVIGGDNAVYTEAQDILLAPQLLAGPALTDSGAASLTEAELGPIVAAAEARWEALGISPSQFAGLQFEIDPIAAGWLGAYQPGTIYLDPTADGYGWFVDPTDRDFTPAGGQERALPGSAAAGHVDLLTVVMHELGHALGLNDVAGGTDLMAEALAAGTRRLPTMADVDAAFRS